MEYVIGIDFGTLSARAVVVNCDSGKVVSEATCNYPHGVMDVALPDGTPLPPDYALQHPDDYLFSLKTSVAQALSSANVSADDVKALGIDFTACTMLGHKLDGTPICSDPRYASDPHAYAKLWKHHGAKNEASDLYRVAKQRGEKWLSYCGDQVSTEWMFPKILETYRQSPSVYDESERFSEAADWLSLMLTGVESHSAAFAGNKAFWHVDYGYPDADYFEQVEKGFGTVIGTKVSPDTAPILTSVGEIDERGAEISGLKVGTVVACPQLDAHSSLISLGIIGPEALMLVLGTSGCYIINHKDQLDISGICASVKNSVIPGLCTYEASIASCGDHLDWFVKNCVPEAYYTEAKSLGVPIHKYLRDKAKKLRVGESGLLALSWFNGNRSPLSDAALSGMIMGITLTTRPEEIYRALIEGVVFQTAIVLERYTTNGININSIIASGGIAKKDEMFMQMLADVLNKPICVANETQTAALGGAVYAAVVAGIYPDLDTAADNMRIGADVCYTPNPETHASYMQLFDLYRTLHDNNMVHDIMHTLKKAQL